jgi:hypothetical protein
MPEVLRERERALIEQYDLPWNSAGHPRQRGVLLS